MNSLTFPVVKALNDTLRATGKGGTYYIVGTDTRMYITTRTQQVLGPCCPKDVMLFIASLLTENAIE